MSDSAEYREPPRPEVSPEERERLIAAGAYFRAEARGFGDGDCDADWLERHGVTHSAYRAGEIAAPGRFVCTHCGERIEPRETAHLPPCPHCYHTEFERERD